MKSDPAELYTFGTIAKVGSARRPTAPAKLSRLTKLFCAAVALPIVSCANTQAVQFASSPVQPLPSYCRASTLTGTKFMRLIHTIVAHGNLTDVAFTEKTLGTRYSVSYGWKVDGTHDPKKVIYQADQLLGNPIHVEIFINPPTTIRTGHEEIALIYITSQSLPDPYANFIDDCLRISAADFFSVFGANFSPSGISGVASALPSTKVQSSPTPEDEMGPYIVGYSQRPPDFVTNASSLYLGFQFGRRSDDGWPNKIIDSVSIEQDQ